MNKYFIKAVTLCNSNILVSQFLSTRKSFLELYLVILTLTSIILILHKSDTCYDTLKYHGDRLKRIQ